MSAPINDGGPAFPCESYGLRNGKVTTVPAQGMTLRDYFAGQALASGKWMYNLEGAGNTATACYLIADAMLEARGGAK